MRNIQKTGFSLVELMVVVAIIAILGVIAVPSYNGYVTASRRAQATTSLTQAFNNYQSYYAANSSYPASNALLPPATQYYTFSSTVNSTLNGSGTYSTTFTLTATPTAAFSDPGCTSLSINQSGQQTSTGTSSTCWAGQ